MSYVMNSEDIIGNEIRLGLGSCQIAMLEFEMKAFVSRKTILDQRRIFPATVFR